ncbi:RDD family protein [Thermocrispum municipale]|uniref:RDD family protein n=1 Tax=Thermocrispum municipale TaxID=37926 RepID=UPI00041148E0|nr:RDD family protein [Thermocrispum municipale]
MARWTETWLSGIGLDTEEGKWPGEKLGLPEHGVNSVASGGQRLLAFLVDLFAAAMITTLFVQPEFANTDVMQRFNWVSVGVWAVLTVPATAFLGITPGMGVLGIRVARLDGATMVGVVRALARCVLTAVLIPPAVRDVDGRGLHDRATGTVVVRMRS